MGLSQKKLLLKQLQTHTKAPLPRAVFSSAVHSSAGWNGPISTSVRCYFRSAACQGQRASNAASHCGFVPRCWVKTDSRGERQQRTAVPLAETAVPDFSSAAQGSAAKICAW
jgi:hypothetical protein